MSTPLSISVVIATFNRQRSLLELLEDLAQQTGLPQGFDVTVVDDGSSQPVKPLLRARNWPFLLQLLEQANGGAAQARHAGILASHGAVVVSIDDDMRIAPDFLMLHLAAHAGGAEVVLGLIRAPHDARNMPIFERFHARQLELFLEDMRAGKPIPGAALCTGNVSFRRARYLEVGGFDLSLQHSEDRDLGIRFKKAGARLAFSERAAVTHHSDHTSRPSWLRRAFLYGVYDSRISAKHPDDGYNDPWHYVWLINPLARPLLFGAVVSPSAAAQVCRATLRAAELADGLGLPRVALKGVTLAYALSYYRGVRSEHASLAATARSFWTFLHKPHAFDVVNDS